MYWKRGRGGKKDGGNRARRRDEKQGERQMAHACMHVCVGRCLSSPPLVPLYERVSTRRLVLADRYTCTATGNLHAHVHLPACLIAFPYGCVHSSTYRPWGGMLTPGVRLRTWNMYSSWPKATKQLSRPQPASYMPVPAGCGGECVRVGGRESGDGVWGKGREGDRGIRLYCIPARNELKHRVMSQHERT